MIELINKKGDWLKGDLLSRFDKIKNSIKKLHKDFEGEAPLKWYTPHGPSHYEIVENMMYQLIPNNYFNKLNINERFFLLSSAWLHDLGMIKGIFDDDKNITDEQIREEHHIRSEKYLIDKYSIVGVEETEATVFGLLSRYHRRRCPISECPEYLPIMGHGNIRVRLLAAYLRLADSLHIDQSRVPAEQYAITLAYNIPMTSKLHWLRSMFVIGIAINVEKKEIIIHFKYPSNLNEWKDHNRETIKRTLSSIYEVIMQDLVDELTTVKEVLFYSDITYFLSVQKEVIGVEFDSQLIIDIKTVLNYYFLMDNPSSSALCRLVIESVRGTLDAHDNLNTESSHQAISDFLNEIETKILRTRQCHTGLRVLVDGINSILKSGDIPLLRDWMINEEEKLEANRKGVRNTASRYFKWKKRTKNYRNKKYIDILLYGYSELVIKSICGFRDTIVSDMLSELLKRNKADIKIHNTNIEAEASEKFRLFICEGQPKNRTAWGGRIIYHDGSRYALTLADRGFTQIYLIADAIAGTVISNNKDEAEMPRIDFVMVGANGFNETEFKHSAGHATIASITKAAQANKHSIELILSLITDKYSENENQLQLPISDPNKSLEKESIKDGWCFQEAFGSEPVRKNIFLSQDPKLRDALSNTPSDILIYNPREDLIPINWVDVVLSEKSWLLKKRENEWGGKLIAEKTKDSC